MMKDFKYHAVWHVLITGSREREYSSAKHTTQPQTPKKHQTDFCPTTTYLAYVKYHGSGFSNNLHDKVTIWS